MQMLVRPARLATKPPYLMPVVVCQQRPHTCQRPMLLRRPYRVVPTAGGARRQPQLVTAHCGRRGALTVAPLGCSLRPLERLPQKAAHDGRRGGQAQH